MKTTSRSAVLQDLVSTLEQLFPGSAVSAGLVRNGTRAFRLVPGPHRPRMLVPAGSRPAAADSVNRPSAHDSFRRSLQRRVLSTALGSPLGGALMPFGLHVGPGTGSISDYLEEAVNAPVVLSLMVGSPRANRKPVLNVHTKDGREIGFAKVGMNELTNRLVDHEYRALQTLATSESADFAVPKVIHHGRWRGNAVLLMTALRPVGKRVQHGVPLRAAAAIAATAPVEIRAVTDSAWYTGLLRDVQVLQGTGESVLPELLDAFGERFAGLELPFGAWHGDFGAWNLAPTEGPLLVWDWERYGQNVPLGIDVVHYLAHPSLRVIDDLGGARHSLDIGCRPALAQVVGWAAGPAYTGDPAVLDALVLGYLLTITARFTFDSLTADGAAVRELARWHQRVLAALLEQTASTVQKRGDYVVD
jgi:hypothetical protein